MKPEEEAKKDYDKAVANKTTAFLGKETKADIFMVHFVIEIEIDRPVVYN